MGWQTGRHLLYGHPSPHLALHQTSLQSVLPFAQGPQRGGCGLRQDDRWRCSVRLRPSRALVCYRTGPCLHVGQARTYCIWGCRWPLPVQDLMLPAGANGQRICMATPSFWPTLPQMSGPAWQSGTLVLARLSTALLQMLRMILSLFSAQRIRPTVSVRSAVLGANPLYLCQLGQTRYTCAFTIGALTQAGSNDPGPTGRAIVAALQQKPRQSGPLPATSGPCLRVSPASVTDGGHALPL